MREYEKKADFIKQIFDFEEVDRPAYVIGPGVDYKHDDFIKLHLDPQLQLETQLIEIEAHDGIDDDYIPMLMPTFGVVGLAEGFGGKVQWHKKDYPKIEPVIKDISDVKKIKKPDVKAGLMGKLLEYTKHFQKETGYKYPVSLSEHNSPVEIMFTLMETTDALVAMMTEPQQVHNLLSIIIETFIDFVNEQKKIAGEFNLGFSIGSTGCYIPDKYGIWLAADSIVNLSPELFEEFFVPSINVLSEEYGGIFLHSCGNFEHQLDSLKLIKNLRGIDFGASETSYEKIVDKYSGKAVLAPHLGLNNRFKFNSLEEYTARLMKYKKTDTGNYFQIQDINSLGYGDDAMNRIGSFYSTILERDRIKGLENILKSQ